MNSDFKKKLQYLDINQNISGFTKIELSFQSPIWGHASIAFGDFVFNSRPWIKTKSFSLEFMIKHFEGKPLGLFQIWCIYSFELINFELYDQFLNLLLSFIWTTLIFKT